MENNSSFKSYFNLFGNTKKKYFGVNENASFIGKNQNNEVVKFGIIDSDTLLEYRENTEDKLRNKFFQKNLKFLDVCETTVFKPIYYNVVYKFICEDELARNNPAFKVNTGRCFIEIEIYTKEACNYTKLPYDSYFVKYKLLVCLYFIIFIIMLVNKEKIMTYAVANIYSMILICYIFLFYFSLWEKTIILPLVGSILIGINLVSYFKEENLALNNIFLYSLCGYIMGNLIMELTFTYLKILNNKEIFGIIFLFIILFNLLNFVAQTQIKSYIIYTICSSILFAYFVSNLYIIILEIKIPIITIANSFVMEGFDISMMKDFMSKKYFIFYIIFFVALILNLIVKNLLCEEKQGTQEERERLNQEIRSIPLEYRSTYLTTNEPPGATVPTSNNN